jgi:hypothetical protein
VLFLLPNTKSEPFCGNFLLSHDITSNTENISMILLVIKKTFSPEFSIGVLFRVLFKFSLPTHSRSLSFYFEKKTRSNIKHKKKGKIHLRTTSSSSTTTTTTAKQQKTSVSNESQLLADSSQR